MKEIDTTFYKALEIKANILGINFNYVIKCLVIGYLVFIITEMIFNNNFSIVYGLFVLMILTFTGIILTRYYDKDFDKIIEVFLYSKRIIGKTIYD